jgi:hypothetical protein
MCSSWPAPHEAPDHFVALDNNRKYNALARCSAPPLAISTSCLAAISSASVRRGHVTAICCCGSPTRIMIFGRKLFREIDLADQFYDSLKQDYREFSDWVATKTNDYARVSTDDQTFLIGNHQERASNSAGKIHPNNLETHRRREASFCEKFQKQRGAGRTLVGSATCLEKVKLPAERVLRIDHLFARMQRLNTYEAKTNAMTRIGSNLSQVLPPPFSCE